MVFVATSLSNRVIIILLLLLLLLFFLNVASTARSLDMCVVVYVFEIF